MSDYGEQKSVLDSLRVDELMLGDDDEEKLIIALDFGTTYSGISWVHSDHPEKLQIIDSWPEGGSSRAEKVPTLIKYTGSSFKWGYELDLVSEDRIEGIKLLLDPTQEKPLYIPPSHTQTELDRLGKPAVEVAADYISAVYKHALTVLDRNYPKEFLDITEKSFVLTVPAVWSDKAKDATLKAAQKAGISPITMIKEPEAAALYVLHEMKDMGLRVGDAFVICDAGGGTVDLISYEILQLAPELKLSELVPGTGGLAGSMMLNKRFEQYVHDALGEKQFAVLKHSDAFRQGMKEFDTSVKTRFSGTDRTFSIPFSGVRLADNKKCGLMNNALTLNKRALDSIFEPLIKDIVKLVDEQISAVERKRMKQGNFEGVKAIFLVGGFGSNTYLLERLRQANEGIKVYQPRSAWTAVVRGAALSKLPNQVSITARSAVRHYGISARAPWTEADAGEEMIWAEHEELNKVAKMTWFINEGDTLSEDKKVSFSFYRTIWCDSLPERFRFTDSLKACDSKIAPKYSSRSNIYENCTLTADLNSIPKSMFKTCKHSSGRSYYKVSYDIALTPKSAQMCYELVFKGKSYGKVEAKY